MSDEAELSISELRRKRAQALANSTPAGGTPPGSTPTSAGHPPTPEPVRPVIEPIVIEPAPRPHPAVHSPAQPVYAQPAPQAYAAAGEENKPLPFDPWRLPTALKRRWYWIILGGLLLCGLGGTAGYYRAKYFVRLTFTLRDLALRSTHSAFEGDAYAPRQIAQQTMINFLTSATLMRRVSSQSTNPVISDRALFSSLTVARERDSDNVAASLLGKNIDDLVRLANLYASNAIELSKETMSRDPIEYCQQQSNNLAEIQLNISNLNQQLSAFLTNNQIIGDPEMQRVAYAKQFSEDLRKLDDLKIELVELERGSTNGSGSSPEVIALAKELADAKQKVRALENKGIKPANPDMKLALEIVQLREQELAAAQRATTNPTAAGDVTLKLKKADLLQRISDYEARVASSRKDAERLVPLIVGYTEIKTQIESYQKAQRNSQNRLSEATQYLKGAEGFYDPPAAVSWKDVDTRGRYKTVIMYGAAGGFLGVFASLALLLLLEITDSRLKTAADVKRVTDLPVLASVGDLSKMDDAARKAWAFRTWTILSGTLSKSTNRGTVCGLISCSHGEGRTTWVELLVDAARQRGYEVTKLDFGKADDRTKHEPAAFAEPAGPPAAKSDEPPAFDDSAPGMSSNLPATSANLKMMQAKAASVIHVQLPGLVWNLERRIQFQDELDKWQTVSTAVILIDLPPASVPEAILLAENLPQVLWLVDSGKSKAGETRMHLQTLRHARCKLVGAVLNHEPVPMIKL